MRQLCFFTICFLWSVALPGLAEDQPNFVFLFTDDQTTYSLGCYGNEDVKTPHIDQLAAEGVVFDKHYNTTAICMASRASVFTG
ncbi:MAG: sulfatase-like hydrolase/transferase, partial [Verrucomicrobiota bacterium]